MEDNNELSGIKVLGFILGTELLGSERGNIEALRALQSKGAEIVVAICNRTPNGGDVGDMCRTLGFITVEIPYGSHFSAQWMINDKRYAWRQIKRLFTNSWKVHRIIVRHKPHLMIIGNTLAYAFIALALTWHRHPLVFRVGDAPNTKSRFQLSLWKTLARRANAIVCISDFIKEQITDLVSLQKNVHVIRNIAPVRTDSLTAETIERVRGHKCFNQGVYIGQITQQKGVPDLIDALIELNDSETGCWIIGGSEHTQELETELKLKVSASKSQTDIQFLGYLNDPRPYISAADWHIAPSNYEEPLGNVVQEAKALGTPSIVTPQGGLPETLSHEKTGWVLETTGQIAIIKLLYRIATQGHGICKEDVLKEHERRFSQTAFENGWYHISRSTIGVHLPSERTGSTSHE